MPDRHAVRLAAAVLMSAVASTASVAAAAETRPIVVELFTSQGCSSCPPADAVLRELALRPDVVALGFHISYWDRLGWKDPLSNPASTERQKTYANRLSGQIYTPQIVIDGTDEAIGSDRAAIFAALRKPRPDARAPVVFGPDRRSVTVGAGSGSGEVVLVRFVRHRRTDVAAGENAGRIADDASGVEAVMPLGTWRGAALSFPIEPPEAGKGVAVLVQAPGGPMLGAALLRSQM